MLVPGTKSGKFRLAMVPSVLFLDDNLQRLEAFNALCTHAEMVTTAQEVIDRLREQKRIDYLFLDHDLGGEVYVDSTRQDCGMEVVRFLVENPCDIGLTVVHTFNFAAGNEMVKALEEAGYEVKRAMFLNDDFRVLLKGMPGTSQEV